MRITNNSPISNTDIKYKSFSLAHPSTLHMTYVLLELPQRASVSEVHEG